jgi:hypothetical protein
MDPQERTDRHPVLELRSLKEPSGRSLVLGLARYIVICGWVWRRKPFVDILFYLCPYAEDSVSVAIQVGDPKHFTSSRSFEIFCISIFVLSAHRRTIVQHDVSNWQRDAYHL